MFATHTLVSYPIVNSYGISKREAVAITIGGTILTDTAVLIILAVIVGASQGEINQDFWVTLGVSFVLFLFIMFGVIPRIAKWFFQKIESEKTAHYIFVLAVVFFAAFLAEIAGLEPIIGAFVAGLALNKLIPHSSALMNRIEFIGNAIFIPFFLISVGMIVDVSVLMKGPDTASAATDATPAFTNALRVMSIRPPCPGHVPARRRAAKQRSRRSIRQNSACMKALRAPITASFMRVRLERWAAMAIGD